MPDLIVSPARFRVLRELLRDGASDQQIAHRLGITIYTVRGHLRELYDATGIHDRCGLALAVDRGQIRVYTERQEGAA